MSIRSQPLAPSNFSGGAGDASGEDGEGKGGGPWAMFRTMGATMSAASPPNGQSETRQMMRIRKLHRLELSLLLLAEQPRRCAFYWRAGG